MLERFAPQGFDVFCASEIFLSQTLALGDAGCISATANVNARGIRAVIDGAATDAVAAESSGRRDSRSCSTSPTSTFVSPIRS